MLYIAYRMNTDQFITPARQAIINGLAVFGFIALIATGIWLAVYSTRFVPTIISRVGGAAVYLGSVLTPASEPTLSVVPTQATSITIPFDETNSTIDEIGTFPTPVTPTLPQQTAPAAGEKTDGAYQIGGAATSVLSGLPDFVVNINAIGYLATTSADSFIASPTVPSDSRPAVRFTIKNIGTNKSGEWRFSASIPTQTSYIYQSLPQQSLNPGDSIEYTLGFDQANRGSGQTISITANFDRTVAESDINNNNASASVTILGS